MLVELLRAGSPELIRRWVGALMMVPESERPSVVKAVTERIAHEYASETAEEDPMFHVATPPVQKDGHTEQVIRSYSAPRKRRNASGSTPRRKRA